MDDKFVTSVVNVRNALDIRLERVMCRGEFTSDRCRVALRHLRCGRFDKCRLFHLADLNDGNANRDDPLKGLIVSDSPDADLRKSFGKMRRAITTATPEISVQAAVFIDKLEEMLTVALGKGVGHLHLGKFYRACMSKVSAPVLRYVGGDGRSSLARFDMAILDDASDARDDFKDAIYERARPSSVDHDSDDGQGPKPKKQRLTKDNKRKFGEVDKEVDKESLQKAKAALKKYNAAAGERAKGVAKGAIVKMPKANSAEMEAFRKAHPPIEVPNCGTRRVCWDFVHPQGCAREDKCFFAHPH